MSSILGSLTATAGALEAQRRGLEVAGQNIANVNTIGYSRRTLQLSERAPLAPGEVGRGVEVVQVRAVRDVFLDARVRTEQQALSHDEVVAEALSVVEAQLGRPGASLDTQLSAFFNAFAALAEDPASLTLRDAAMRESERLAAGFRDMAASVQRSQQDADVGVRSTVDEVNRLATEVARVNERIGSSSGLDLESLLDQRQTLLRDLSDLVDVVVTEASGTVTVALSSGPALVAGGTVIPLEVENQAGTGLARILSREQDVTDGVAGGQLAGWLGVRDSRVPAYVEMLDRLAWDLASAVNAVHTSGVDAEGDPGLDLFDVGPTLAGAAASMTLTAAIAADARLIVAADATSNGAARAMAALRDGPVIDGETTASDYWGQIVYRVGADAGAAARAQAGRQQVVTQLQRLRDAASGVSLDEEAASLMRYQRAYEANARYFTAVNDVLDVLMGLVR